MSFYVECMACGRNAQTDDSYWIQNHECPEPTNSESV